MPTRSPVRPRLTTKGAATRRRIIAGAAAVIRERGAAAVTLDDICAVTSTSKGQLFHYFPAGREELLLAVAEHESEQVLTDQEPHLSRLADWADWYAWRDAVVARYERHGPDCPLGVLLTELGRRSPGEWLSHPDYSSAGRKRCGPGSSRCRSGATSTARLTPSGRRVRSWPLFRAASRS